MKKAWKVAKWTLLVLLVAIVYAGYRIGWGHPFTINQLANRQALFVLLDDPETFTSVGILDGSIFDHHSGLLRAVGNAKRDYDYAEAKKHLDEVRKFDRASLNAQDRITYDVLANLHGSALDLKRFDWLSSEGLYPISPQFGKEAQLLGFMQTQHVVKNDKTARNYVLRLIAMGPNLDALTADMQRQATVGVVLPAGMVKLIVRLPDENWIIASSTPVAGVTDGAKVSVTDPAMATG